MMTNNNNNSHDEIGRMTNFMKNIVWSFPESRLTIKREIVGYRQQSFSRLNLHLTITLHVPLTKHVLVQTWFSCLEACEYNT